jgi:hypothetical protein
LFERVPCRQEEVLRGWVKRADIEPADHAGQEPSQSRLTATVQALHDNQPRPRHPHSRTPVQRETVTRREAAVSRGRSETRQCTEGAETVLTRSRKFCSSVQ